MLLVIEGQYRPASWEINDSGLHAGRLYRNCKQALQVVAGRQAGRNGGECSTSRPDRQRTAANALCRPIARLTTARVTTETYQSDGRTSKVTRPSKWAVTTSQRPRWDGRAVRQIPAAVRYVRPRGNRDDRRTAARRPIWQAIDSKTAAVSGDRRALRRCWTRVRMCDERGDQKRAGFGFARSSRF